MSKKTLAVNNSEISDLLQISVEVVKNMTDITQYCDSRIRDFFVINFIIWCVYNIVWVLILHKFFVLRHQLNCRQQSTEGICAKKWREIQSRESEPHEVRPGLTSKSEPKQIYNMSEEYDMKYKHFVTKNPRQMKRKYEFV